jgi:oligoribonuclease NrnB/cAMP/cGMP phosphodiesterase (DHH superfamily)
VRPGDSGLKLVEVARAFSIWRTQKPDTLPRAIILRAVNEGNTLLEVRFSSNRDAVSALRPRLRISYTPRVPLRVP